MHNSLWEKIVLFYENIESLYAKLRRCLVLKLASPNGWSGQAYKGDSDSWRIRHRVIYGLLACCYK